MGIRYTYAESESFRTEPVLVEKTITTNGSYDAASDNADGYSVVTVNVEGGGGSSDFSTAEVTVVIEETSTAESCEFYYAEIIDNEEFSGIVPTNSFYSGDYLMPLYKGVCQMYIRGNIPNTISVTGNVTYEAYPDDNEGIFTITGDCTITIS